MEKRLITLRDKLSENEKPTNLKLVHEVKDGKTLLRLDDPFFDVLVPDDLVVKKTPVVDESIQQYGQPFLVKSEVDLQNIRNSLSCLYRRIDDSDEVLKTPFEGEKGKIEIFIEGYFSLEPVHINKPIIKISTSFDVVALRGLFYFIWFQYKDSLDLPFHTNKKGNKPIQRNMILILMNVFSHFEQTEDFFKSMVSSFKRIPKKYFSEESKKYFEERD
jgi:hypothetical protein